MRELTWSVSRRRAVAARMTGLALCWTLVSWIVIFPFVDGDVLPRLLVSLIAATSCLVGLILLGTSNMAARLILGYVALLLIVLGLVGVGAFFYLMPAGILMTLVFFIGLHEAAYP